MDVSDLQKTLGKWAGPRSKPEGVQITERHSGTIQLDHDALKKMLICPEIGDRPIALISIFGALRTGKSFLFNFFLRYLRNKGWENSKWIGDDNTAVEDGIPWRGGKDRDTVGIIIWNEVFILKRFNGQEVAVLLMDSQGLYDEESSEETNTRLLTLGAVASSVLINNIFRTIQQRDLIHLQTCVEYALIAAKKELSHFQLQNLLFLIRDWDFVQDHKFGWEGGKEYLEEYMKKRDDSEELNQIRQYLLSTFSSHDGFLLPEPGRKVRQCGVEKVKNKDTEEGFLTSVADLVAGLLHPDRIVVKHTQGRNLSAREILNLLATTNDVFDEEHYDPEAFLEATTKAHYATAYEEAIEIYDSIVEGEIGEAIIEDEKKLDGIHQRARREGLASFDSVSHMGDEAIRNDFLLNLIDECDNHFHTTKERNDNRKMNRAVEEGWATDSAFMEYKEKMAQYSGSNEYGEQPNSEIETPLSPELALMFSQAYRRYAVLEEELRRLHEKVSKEVEAKAAQTAKANIMELRKLMEKYLERILNENREKAIEEEAVKETEDKSISRKTQDLVYEYRNKLEEKTTDLITTQDLENFNREQKPIFEKAFQDKFKDHPRYEKYHGKLMKKMDGCYSETFMDIHGRMKAERKAIKIRMDSIALNYREDFQKTMSESYVIPATIEEKQKECERELQENWSTLFPDCPKILEGYAKKKGKERILLEFTDLKQKNKENKHKRVRRTKVVGNEKKKRSWCILL